MLQTTIYNEIILAWLTLINKDIQFCDKWMSVTQLLQLFQLNNKDGIINYAIFSRQLSSIYKCHQYLDKKRDRLETGSKREVLYLINNIQLKSYSEQYICEPPHIC